MVSRYSQPHRSYHTLEHVAAVLADAARLAGELGLHPRERATVAAAACGHDVVYDARPGDDERASARWTRDALLAARVVEPDADRAAEIVLATATHEAPPGDVAAAVLLDADLAVLASPAADYARYVAAVRAEYRTLDDAAWRAGRAAVMAALLAGPLFRTAPGRVWWDAAARENVSAELARLRSAG